jgi:leucyl/phenylalanyl-tRNA--protein transferase
MVRAMASTSDRPGPLARAAVLDRRGVLFRETALETCERVALGAAWTLRPKRIARLWPLARLWVADLTASDRGLPQPEDARDDSGLCGIARDLSPPTLIAAYRRGLFPGGHTAPVKWLSPPARCVLFFDEFHIAKRLRRVMRQGRYAVTFDRDFERVIKACASRREGRWHVTWITPRIMRAYADLHDAGHVHSFEVWNEAGALVGGGYGVAFGRIFSTESQFSHEPNTSKVGFSVLNWHLARWGYVLNDGKNATPTIVEMGFRMIPRIQLQLHLALDGGDAGGRPGRWEVEAGADVVAGWQPEQIHVAE